MARQPRGLAVRSLILSILGRREAYGCEVAAELGRAAETADLPEGCVYPALRRLERDGLATGHWVEVGGEIPRRRYYVLTPKGLAELDLLRPAQRPAPAPSRLGEIRP